MISANRAVASPSPAPLPYGSEVLGPRTGYPGRTPIVWVPPAAVGGDRAPVTATCAAARQTWHAAAPALRRRRASGNEPPPGSSPHTHRPPTQLCYRMAQAAAPQPLAQTGPPDTRRRRCPSRRVMAARASWLTTRRRGPPPALGSLPNLCCARPEGSRWGRIFQEDLPSPRPIVSGRACPFWGPLHSQRAQRAQALSGGAGVGPRPALLLRLDMH